MNVYILEPEATLGQKGCLLKTGSVPLTTFSTSFTLSPPQCPRWVKVPMSRPRIPATIQQGGTVGFPLKPKVVFPILPSRKEEGEENFEEWDDLLLREGCQLAYREWDRKYEDLKLCMK